MCICLHNLSASRSGNISQCDVRWKKKHDIISSACLQSCTQHLLLLLLPPPSPTRQHNNPGCSHTPRHRRDPSIPARTGSLPSDGAKLSWLRRDGSNARKKSKKVKKEDSSGLQVPTEGSQGSCAMRLTDKQESSEEGKKMPSFRWLNYMTFFLHPFIFNLNNLLWIHLSSHLLLQKWVLEQPVFFYEEEKT